MFVKAISLKLTSNFKFAFILSRGRTLLILGHMLENKVAAIELFKMYAIDVISLESFHQLTSSLIYDVIPPKG